MSILESTCRNEFRSIFGSWFELGPSSGSASKCVPTRWVPSQITVFSTLQIYAMYMSYRSIFWIEYKKKGSHLMHHYHLTKKPRITEKRTKILVTFKGKLCTRLKTMKRQIDWHQDHDDTMVGVTSQIFV